jgi:hypothetical protein
LDGCVLAMDGFAVLTRQPYNKEVKYKKDYRYRKGGFAIVVLAGCDINCHFIVASCNHSGSTNDIIAWQHMDLFEAVEIDKKLPLKFFFYWRRSLYKHESVSEPIARYVDTNALF